MEYRGFSVSPDGRRLVVEVGPRKDGDLWLLDLEQDTQTQLTIDEAGAYDPVWSPDGEFVYFGSKRDGKSGLFLKRADGSGEAERLTESDGPQVPESVSPDGRYLAYFWREEDDWDIWLLPLSRKEPPHKLFESSFNAVAPRFSPDGRWVSYLSDETGRIEVYVRPFPGLDGKVQVRTEGGELRAGGPHWSADGRRLFYVSPEETIYELTVMVREGALEVGPPQKLFRLPPESLWRAGQGYWDVRSDGQRFYFVQPAPVVQPAPE